MFFWSMVCMTSSTLILFFRKDNSIDIMKNKNDIMQGIQKSYISFWKIVNIKAVQALCIAVVTAWVSTRFSKTQTKKLFFAVGGGGGGYFIPLMMMMTRVVALAMRGTQGRVGVIAEQSEGHLELQGRNYWY